MYNSAQEELPPQLRNKFRFGIKPELVEKKHPKLKYLMSMSNAVHREKEYVLRNEIVKKWGNHDTDSGSSQVQIAILTRKIRSMLSHLQKNKKDKQMLRALQIYVSRRKSLMKHLKKNNAETYYRLLADIRLPDMVEVYKK